MRLIGRIVSSLLLCSSFFCYAQGTATKQSGITADYSKEPYVVEHCSTKLTVEEDGSDVRDIAAEINLLADAGVKRFAVLTFTYTSGSQSIDVDYVRVRKPDGTIVKTPDYNIQDMPADVTRTAPMYSDVREKHVAVKGLGVGDVLEYEIHLRVLRSDVPGQFWYEYSFGKNEIIRDERVELSIPKDKSLMVKSPDFRPEVREEGARKIYKWKYSYLERQEQQEQALPSKRTTPPPSIQVTTFSKWEEIGHWYWNLQKDQVVVTPAIEAKARELTKGLSSDDEKLRSIYKFVSLGIHYIGLDFGIGRYQPHAADEVLSNEYGDCKDKHTLLASLLKAAGYEAWPALIHDSRKLNVEVPSPAQFNHVITVVPRGNKLVWLDTTPEVSPYGFVLVNLREKQALVIPDRKPPTLISTPSDPPFDTEQRFTINAKLGQDGVLKGHVEQKYRGDVEVVLRAVLRQAPQPNWKDMLQNFSYSLGFAGEISNVVVGSLEDTAQPLQISYDYTRKEFGDWENHRITAPLPPMGIEAAANQKSEKPPKEPILLGARGEIVFESRIELPPGSSIVPPKNLTVVEPYAQYRTENTLENGVFRTKRRLSVINTEVPVSEWQEYQKLAKTVSDDEFNFLQLNGMGGEASAVTDEKQRAMDRKFDDAVDAFKRKDFLRAEELFQQILAEDPKYKWVHYNLALIRGNQARVAEALVEFRKEEELSPEEVTPMQAAASMATYYHQTDDAILELRKVLKIDPKNREAARNLGELLSENGRYAEATEALEIAVQASPDSSALQFELSDAYIKSSKYDKAVPHLQIALEQNEKSAISDDGKMLNKVAYTLAEANAGLDLAKRCSDKALAQLDARSNASDIPADARLRLSLDYSLVWDTAGWIYFKLGDFNRAENYLQAAWLLGQDATVGEHLGEVYEKLGMSQKAAHTYELAYAASGNSRGRPETLLSENVLNGYQKTRGEIETKHKKLTGNSIVPTVIKLKPRTKGQWSMSAVEELSRMREAKLGVTGPNSSAEFELMFAANKPSTVKFVSGSPEMKALSSKLAVAKFQVEFPVDSQASLLRRVMVHCSQYAPCTAVMLPLQ